MKTTLSKVELSQNEIWKILDAIKAYKQDYSVSESVDKIFANIEKKLKKAKE